MIHHRFARYNVALVAVALALLCRLGLNPYLHDASPFMYFFVAIIVSAWLGGLGPGLLAAGLGGFVVDYFYLEPLHTILGGGSKENIQVVSFMTLGTVVSLIVARMRHEKRRAEQAAGKAQASETETRRAGAALRESEERFRTMADSLPQLAWIAQADGFIFWYNRRWYEYTGTTPEQMEGWGWQSVHDPNVLPQVLVQWKGSIATGEPFDMVFPLRGADGQFRPFLTRVMPLKDEQGRVVQWFGTNTDVDELKRAEESLRESEQRLSLAQQAARIGSFDWNIQTNVNIWSPELEAMYGLQRGEFGRTQIAWEQLVHPEDRQSAISLVNRTFETGQPVEGEWRVQWQDGSVHWIFGRFQVLKDEAGKPLRLTGVNIDITERKRMEQVLRESEERWATTLTSIGDAVIATDVDGKVTFMNAVAEALTGWALVEAQTRPVTEVFYIVNEDTRAKVEDPVSKVLREGMVVGLANHTVLVGKDGTEVPIDDSGAPIRDRDGKIMGVVLVFRDVTESKQTERERAITVDFLRLVNESRGTRDLIRAATTFFQEQSGCEAVGVRLKEGDDYPYYEARGFSREFVLAENQLCARDATGQPCRDSCGNPVMECMCGNVICGRFDLAKPFFTERGSFWANNTTRLLATTTDADRQTPTRNRCNGEGYESVALIALRLGGESLGLLQLNDRRQNRFSPEIITLWERLADYLAVALAKSRAEEALRNNEALLRAATDNASVGLVMLDRERRYTFANPTYVRILGLPYAAEELIGKGPAEVLASVYETQISPRLDRAFAGERVTYELSRPHTDGGLMHYFVVYDPQRDETGIGAVIVTIFEITEIKRAEAELAAAHRQIQSIIDNTPAIVYAFDLEERFVMANAALAELLNSTPEQMIGKRRYEFMPKEDADWHEANDRQAIEAGRALEFEEYSQLDGRSITWLTTKFPLRDAQGRIYAVAGISADISERKQAEVELERHRQHLEELVQERTEEVRRSMDLAQAERQRLFDVLETLPAMVCLLTQDYHITFANRSFREKFGESHGRHCYDYCFGRNEPCDFCESYNVLKTGQPHHWECHCPNGSLIDAYDFPFTDVDGTPMILEMDFDITARRKAETELAIYRENLEELVKERTVQLETANEQLTQTDRRKDEFLAMLAHELRNPLAPVRYAVQIMNACCNPVCPSHERTVHQRDIIERQIGHMAHLIEDLLDVARVNSGKIELRKEMIDLVTAVRHSIDSCHQALENKNQELIASLPEEPLWLEGDRTRLEQVFNNLLGNAIKYSPANRRVWVNVSLERTDGDRSTAVVRVRDEGEGISGELLPHVFELFTQGERGLDRAQGGLGIGLTMVQRLVQKHGGTIEAHSEGLNKGSEFIVRLPLIVETAPRVANSRQVAPSFVGASLKILTVDDVVDTAQSLAELLELFGHQTRVAFSGLAALEIARTWHPEVVLLDIGMPGMDGYEVARRLRAEYGKDGMTLIALTGYGQESDRAGAHEAGFDDLLVKPVDLDALRVALEKIKCEQA